MNRKPKLSDAEVDEILTVIHHTRRNMSWEDGGSFIDEDGNFDPKEVAKAERGIKLIEQLIMQQIRK